MYPNEIYNYLKPKITRQMKIAFVSSMIFGLITHLYMFTNKLPNYDDVNCLTFYGTGFESGRFVLSIMGNIVKILFGNYSLPWLNGLMTITLISISVSGIVHVLKIKRGIYCVLTGMLIISFPSLTGTFFFMFTSYFYAAGILMAVLSACAAVFLKRGTIPAALLLMCATATYQAYFPITAVLLLLVVLSMCLERQEAIKIWKTILKYIVILVLALILYLVCNKLILALIGREMGAYQNLDQMGHVSISDLFLSVNKAYSTYFQLWFSNVSGINAYASVRIVIVLIHVIFFAVISINTILKSKQKPLSVKSFYIIMEMLCILVFPLFVNAIYIMGNGSFVYSIMLYPMVFIFIMAVMMLDHLEKIPHKPFGSLVNKCRIFLSWAGCLIFLFTSAAQAYYANTQYLAMDMQFKQAYSYFTTMISEIKMTDGYDDSLPLVIIGTNIEDLSFYENEDFPETLSGRSGVLLNEYSRNFFLKRYLGFNQEIASDTAQWTKLPQVQQMPTYPDPGSVQVIEGGIVLKIE